MIRVVQVAGKNCNRALPTWWGSLDLEERNYAETLSLALIKNNMQVA